MERRTQLTQIETAKAWLEATLAELKMRQQHLERDLAEPLDPDSSERAVEMEDDASLEAQAALVSREVASIDRALERIGEGTYGTCVSCGEQIAPARLEARPEAALCIGCASRKA
jgi:DnaK suppressor protein